MDTTPTSSAPPALPRSRKKQILWVLLAIGFLLFSGGIIYWNALTRDDAELVFSPVLTDHFPELESPHPSAELIARLFLSADPATGKEFFFPWSREVQRRWNAEVQLARREKRDFDPSRIEVADLWPKTLPLRKEISALHEGGTISLYNYPYTHPLIDILNFQEPRSFTRLLIAGIHQQPEASDKVAALVSWVWLLGEMNQQTVTITDFMVTTAILRALWHDISDTILADEQMRTSFAEWTRKWPFTLARAYQAEGLSLHKIFTNAEKEEESLHRFLLMSESVERKETFLDQILQIPGEWYAKFSMNHLTRPIQTQNEYWKILQTGASLLERQEFDEFQRFHHETIERFNKEVFDSHLLSPNKGGYAIMFLVIPSLNRTIEVSRDLTREFTEAVEAYIE